MTELPPASATPLAVGFVTAVAVLAGFALPPLLQLSRVPALRVLRRDVGPPPPLVLLAFGPAVAVVLLLIYWVVPERRLFLYFTGGLAAFVLVLTLAGLAAGARSRAGCAGGVGVAWRYGVANLSRRRAESVVQLVAFGTGIMVLLLLSILRNDLNSDWRRTLPQNLPNYFFVNIPPQSRAEFVDFLQAQGARTTRVLPMIRGRLTAINGRPVEESHGRAGEDSFATREQNLTWAAELGPDNRIVAGRWWSAADFGQPLVSLASEFQESLGVERRRPADLRHRRRDSRGHGGEHPQGEVGHLPAQFLHRVRAGRARRHRRHLPDERLFRSGRRTLARTARAPLSERLDLRHR